VLPRFLVFGTKNLVFGGGRPLWCGLFLVCFGCRRRLGVVSALVFVPVGCSSLFGWFLRFFLVFYGKRFFCFFGVADHGVFFFFWSLTPFVFCCFGCVVDFGFFGAVLCSGRGHAFLFFLGIARLFFTSAR